MVPVLYTTFVYTYTCALIFYVWAIQVLRNTVGVSDSPEKNVKKVYSSTLLAGGKKKVNSSPDSMS